MKCIFSLLKGFFEIPAKIIEDFLGIRFAAYQSMLENLKRQYSQWMTPSELAERLVRWAKVQPGERVLEPSSGDGSIVKAFRKIYPENEIHGIEIDYDLYQRTKSLCPTWFGSFLDYHRHYDLIVMNPPYESGQDTRHLRHAVTLAPRVVALLRLQALAGVQRYEFFWDNVHLHRLVILTKRPKFQGPVAGSPRSDYIIVEVRKEPTENTHIAWW